MISSDAAFEILRGVPLFADLEDDDVRAVADRCSERRYDKGETLWLAGAEGDDFLVIASGELTVWSSGGGGPDEVLARLGRGHCVGEVSLLLDEGRSATVTCTRAARVLALAKADFRDVVRGDSRTLVRISEVLSRRVANVAQRRPAEDSRLVVGVLAEPGLPGASLVAGAVAAFLGELLSRPVPLERMTVAGDDLDRLVSDRMPAAVGVVDLPPGIDIITASASCDVVIVLTDDLSLTTDAVAGTRVLRVVNLHGRSTPSPPVTACEPFILPADAALDGATVDRQVHHLLTNREAPASIVLRRLARKVLGVSVGIALGGGAAFGLAHIGVLQALHDAGIDVDLAAGASMGSVVAIGYAAGLSPDQLRDVTERIGTVRTTLSVLDPSLTGSGLLAGRRMVSILAPMLPERGQTFEQLVRPCQVLATDIESGERVLLAHGRLDAAVRTSCAIPVIFTPVKAGERTLVDGALVDPVPADVLHEMGADVTVAVNVVPQLQRGVSTAISRMFRQVKRLNPLAGRRGSVDAPHILDVLMNTLQIIEYELGKFTSLCADVRITVDLAEFTWIEFYRGLEIIERGRAAGERAVPELREAIDRRLAPYQQSRA